MTRPTFVGLCEQIIRRVAARYSCRPEEWDDFVQDAWLGILTSLDRGYFDPGHGRLEDWLFVVVRNQAVWLSRRRWRNEQRREAFPLESLASVGDDDPSQSLDRCGRIEAVRTALELLAQRVSPKVYAVFQLRRLQEVSVDEVGLRLGLTPEQVRVYDHRARRKLATILVHHGWSASEFFL